MPDGTWHCARWDDAIPVDAQRVGCDSHVIHPDLVPWKRKVGGEWTAIYIVDGKDVENGEGAYASGEVLANAAACNDPVVNHVRKEFGARIVG